MLFSFFSFAMAQEQTLPQAPIEAEYSRQYLMETNVRVRNLFLPDKLLDTWFYDSDTPGAYTEDRPDIRAYTIGLEYVFAREDTGNWLIWAEYMGSGLSEGYWDDIEKGETVDHDDGDWVRPDNFSGWWAGFDYMGEWDITPASNSVWLSFLAGGGLGAGYITGDLTYWTPGSTAATGSPDDCLPVSPAYIRHSECDPDGTKEFPRFLPMLDITLATKVNFSDRAHIRFDAGIHDMFFYGAALGGIF